MCNIIYKKLIFTRGEGSRMKSKKGKETKRHKFPGSKLVSHRDVTYSSSGERSHRHIVMASCIVTWSLDSQ